MASSIIKFIDEEYPAADHSQDIQVVPDAYRKRVKGIDIYFPKEDYSRTWDLFEKMQEITTVVTHGSANVRSLFSDYRRGHISIEINPASKQYEEEHIIILIKKIVRMIKKHPSPARI